MKGFKNLNIGFKFKHNPGFYGMFRSPDLVKDKGPPPYVDGASEDYWDEMREMIHALKDMATVSFYVYRPTSTNKNSPHSLTTKLQADFPVPFTVPDISNLEKKE